MAREDIELGVSVEHRDAVRDLEDVADAAEEVEDSSPDVTVTAEDMASTALRDVRDEAEQTTRALQDVKEKGAQPSANAIADLTGPLGEASGAASDFGGALEGAGELAEGLATKLGASSEQAGAIGAAIGGPVALAVAGVAAGVGLWQERQRKAREEAEKTAAAALEVATALREGDAAAAAEKMAEEYADLFDAAEDAGVSVKDLSDALAGNGTAIEDAATAAEAYADTFNNRTMYTVAGQGARDHADALRALADDAAGASRAVDEQGNVLDRTTARQDALTEALGRANAATVEAEDAFKSYSAALDEESSFLSAVGDADALAGSLEELARLEGENKTGTEEYADAQRAAAEDTNALKGTVLDLIEQYGEIPPEERTRILAELPTAQQQTFSNWMAEVEEGATAPIAVEVTRESLSRAAGAVNAALGGWGGFSFGRSAPSSSTVNVTIAAPAGMTAAQLIAEGERYVRRNGGRLLTGRRR